jgi:hypothetical protein
MKKKARLKPSFIQASFFLLYSLQKAVDGGDFPVS